MTMAPGRKKRGYWLEMILISILLFLLIGSRSQNTRSTGVGSDFKHALQRSFVAQPLNLK
jgi:hypothetical protein